MAPLRTPPGSCDPASRGDAFNETTLAVGNGDVTVKIRYGWDGTSTRATGCDGPLVDGTGSGNKWAVSYANNGPTTYYMHTIGNNGQARTFTLNPGQSGTLTAAQAASRGYVNYSDCLDLSLSTAP